MAPLQRDPVSVLVSPEGVARLLERAYAARGDWVATRIPDPSVRQAAALAAQGIDVYAADRKSGSGSLNARTRWARGFVRAIYYANDARHGGRGRPIEIEIGRHKPALGTIPAGRAIRIRRRMGGKTMLSAVEAKPESQRWNTMTNRADPARREWTA